MTTHDIDEVFLGVGVEEALAFNDPALSDEEFKKRLIRQIYFDDVAIRVGTRSESYEDHTLARAKSAVAQAVAIHGADRDKIISAAYNQCSNSQPLPMMPYTEPKLLSGSAYEKFAREKYPRPNS